MAEQRFPGMRWLVVCILVLALGAGPASPTAASAAAVSMPGDANGDGMVNLFDLVIVARAYHPAAAATDRRADVSGDGVVDLFDLVFVSTRLGTMSPAIAPTSTGFAECVYTLEKESIVVGYTVRLWQCAGKLPFVHRILTIDGMGQPRRQVDDVFELDPLTGSDVTGEGNPDVVVHTFTYGAHCCATTVVYDLGPVAKKVLETPLSNCSAELANLDGDAALEVKTCDDIFAYRYCPYVISPMPRVVLDYVPGEGYVPASPRFAYLYAADIVTHNLEAQRSVATDGCAGSKCAVLAVVLDYLYAGYVHEAWSELYRLYTCTDVNTFAAEIQATVESSSLYTP